MIMRHSQNSRNYKSHDAYSGHSLHLSVNAADPRSMVALLEASQQRKLHKVA